MTDKMMFIGKEFLREALTGLLLAWCLCIHLDQTVLKTGPSLKLYTKPLFLGPNVYCVKAKMIVGSNVVYRYEGLCTAEASSAAYRLVVVL